MSVSHGISITRPHRASVLIWRHLERIENRVSRAEQQVLAAYNLTVPQFGVLSALAGEPGMSQQTLAGQLLVTKGNVCGLIDRLEEAGLVERRPDPEDGRSHRVYLTGQGDSLFRAVAPALDETLGSQM